MTGKPRAARPPQAAAAVAAAFEGGVFAALARFLLRLTAALTAWFIRPRHLKRVTSEVAELKQKVDSLTGQILAITDDEATHLVEFDLLRQLGDAVIAADSHGAVKIFNQPARDIFEEEPEAMFGGNLHDFLSSRCRTSSRDLPRVFSKNEQVKNLRVEFVGMKGKVTPCLLTVDRVGYGPKDQRKTAFVAIIKDNSEVERIASMDQMTGLYNRRYLDRKIEEEYRLLTTGKISALSLIFLDIDLFGQFNKKYGHQVGDEVLGLVGHALRKVIRCNDTAARYGGEEFVVISAATDEHGAQVLAERIRRNISNLRCEIPALGAVRITASVGSSTHHHGTATSAKQLIDEADDAMRLAKRNGRNQTKDYAAVRASHLDVRID